MSLQEQIDEAWKSGLPWIAEDDYPTVPIEQMNRLLKETFSDGYRAAMKSLFLEVKPEDVKPDTTYYFLTDDKWSEERVVTIELLDLLAKSAEAICRLNLPSDIFGEEG